MADVDNRTCEQCGDAFVSARVRRYCSAKCRNRAAYLASKSDGRREQYEARRKADGRYSADLERRQQQTVERAAARSCPYCESPMAPRKRKHCGAPECLRQFNNQRVREYMRKYKAENGVAYTARYRDLDHGEKLAALPKIPEKMTARRQEGWQRRRARKLARPAEQFRHEDVYERDGWICGLCVEPVDRELRYPDPMSPSLDHVLPLSRGGHHVLGNVQLAHLTCNTKKRDRVAEEA